jgi:hypothetical protein
MTYATKHTKPDRFWQNVFAKVGLRRVTMPTASYEETVATHTEPGIVPWLRQVAGEKWMAFSADTTPGEAARQFRERFKREPRETRETGGAVLVGPQNDFTGTENMRGE